MTGIMLEFYITLIFFLKFLFTISNSKFIISVAILQILLYLSIYVQINLNLSYSTISDFVFWYPRDGLISNDYSHIMRISNESVERRESKWSALAECTLRPYLHYWHSIIIVKWTLFAGIITGETFEVLESAWDNAIWHKYRRILRGESGRKARDLPDH